MALPLPVAFFAGTSGVWRIDRVDPVVGDGLSMARRIAVVEGRDAFRQRDCTWVLRGVTSNARYSTRDELDSLEGKQEPLLRAQATRAALIPVRKSEAWWSLAQDERRLIFEEDSQHIAMGLEYLPAVARRLHHSRELGEEFDFLTWFEYAPEHSEKFEELVRRLRETKEWRYVDREVDIRLSRD